MMKRKRCFIAVLVAVCLTVVVPASAFAAGATLPVTVGDAAAAQIDVSWFAENPDEDEYQINSAAQLRGLAALVNGTACDAEGKGIPAQSFEGVTVHQAASIDLSDTEYTLVVPSGYIVYEWTPIGTQEHPFAGTFQGAGREIRGLYLTEQVQNAGLFGFCSSTSSIEGVHLSAEGGASVSATSETSQIRNVGSLVGYTAGHVSGCSSDVTVRIESTGTQAATVEIPHVVRCIGGVAGYVQGNLSNCTFSGTVDVQVASDAAAPDTSSESLCVGDSIGGVVGRFGEPASHGSISGCRNEGTVFTRTTGAAAADRFGTTTYANLFHVGGIVGYSNGSIFDCTNGSYHAFLGTTTGTVSTSSLDVPDGAPLNNRGADQVGGICGGLRSVSDDPERYNDGDPYDPMTVSNCHNVGHVTGSVACGGIVGETGVYCTITSCSNGIAGDTSQTAGKIISARWNKPFSAGIVGETRGGNVNYCANYAEIRNIQTGYYMAGICGALFVSDDYPDVTPELYACLNVGGVYTINTADAVEYREAGLVGQNEGYVHDSVCQDGCVPYHGNALIGASDWGMWNNLEVRSASDVQTSQTAAFLNARAAQNQNWDRYWFVNGSGYPVLSMWENLGEDDRTLLARESIASVEEIAPAPYVGAAGGSLPTLSVTLTDGTVLVQNADFYVLPQAGAVNISSGKDYLASIVGLGMYRGTVENCAQYSIGATCLEDAHMVVDPMSYNGGRVVFPQNLQVLMGTSAIDSSEYNYVIYSRHVTNTSVKTGASGNTVAFDSLGYISFDANGSDKVPVSTMSAEQINAETRAYWLWDRKGELISNSAGEVYYTTTSGGGTAGMPFGDGTESCVSHRSGTPAGFVVQVCANEDSPVLTGSCIGNYEIKTLNLVRDCTFEGVQVQGKTWYWDADAQSFFEVDDQGQRIQGMPSAVFAGQSVAPAATISNTLADGGTYTLVEDEDYRVFLGDPEVESDYRNRNVTDYESPEKQRACVTNV